MTNLASGNRLSKPGYWYYRFLITLVGLAFLLWYSAAQPESVNVRVALVIAFFVAIQTYFPLHLLLNEMSLIQITTLGSGLLFGAATAGWGAVAGILAGAVFRAGLKGRQNGLRSGSLWLGAGFHAGLEVTALLLSLAAAGSLSGMAAIPNFQTMREAMAGLFPILLLFAILHGVLLTIDFLLRRSPDLRVSRREFISLAIIEMLPLPFVWLAVMSYPEIGMGALVALAAVPVIVVILMSNLTNARLGLEGRLRELSTLNQVSRSLQSTLNLEELLITVHQQLHSLTGLENICVALLEGKDRFAFPLVVIQEEVLIWPPSMVSDGPMGWILRASRPVYWERDQAGADELLLPGGVRPASWIGLPLISSDRLFGCIGLFSLVQKPDHDWPPLDLLATLSGQVSMAIEKAILYEQTERRAAQLENLSRLSGLITASLDLQEVLVQVCRSVTQVGGTRSAIYLLDSDKSKVWLAASYGLSAEFVHENQSFEIAHDGRTRCLRTGREVITTDLDRLAVEGSFLDSLQNEGIRSFGDFPLVAPEGQIGYLSVYFDRDHRVDEEEVELLQTFASQAALAVSNARLHSRTDLALSRRAHQLSILEAVGREFAAETYSERLFEKILRFSMEFTNSPWGNLSLLNPGTRWLEVKASIGYEQDWRSHSIERGISGRAARTREIINLPDVRQDPDYIDHTGGQARSQLSIPLVQRGRVLGVLTLERQVMGGFSPNDEPFISQLANQAAIAVENAELVHETQERLREQSQLYSVSRRLVGTLDADAVVAILQQAVLEMIDRGGSAVYLWDRKLERYILFRTGQSEEALEDHRSVGTGAGERIQGLLKRLPESLDGSEFGISTGLEDAQPFHVPSKRMHAPWSEIFTGCAITVMPLVAQKERLGMILICTKRGNAPQVEDFPLLMAIANQGAISLQNAVLFSDVTLGRDRLSAVINSVSEGILLLDVNGRITLANDSVQEILGLKPAEISGQLLAHLDPDSLGALGFTAAQKEELIKAIGSGQVQMMAKSTMKVDAVQSERVLERSILPVWGGSGRLVGWMIVLRDITEEHQLAQTRELLTETLVHDLRSPLGTVHGALEMLHDGLDNQANFPDEMSRQALSVARRATGRVLGLVETLLDISRMQAGGMELNRTALELYPHCATILSDFIPQAQEFGVILHNEVPDDLAPAYADPSKISRVLANLLDNALKFTPSGGQVTIQAEARAGLIVVKVVDTGPGVPDQYREKIFERFSQVPGRRGRRRGSGLGLTFCRLTVEAHGGRIWHEPGETCGSVFLFSLPAYPPTET